MTAAVAWAASPAYAAESFKVLKVNTTGCNSGGLGMLVERAGLDGSGGYLVRTVATVDGLVYMNENASISTNTVSGWNLFNNFSYGAVSNPGTWPIPENRQLRLAFTIERPKGTVLFDWSAVIDGCNTGRLLYSGRPADDEDDDFVGLPWDKCPTLRATTLDGCPARSLTIAYDRQNDRFVGWLYAKGFPKLYSRRVVTIWKVRPGPDRKIGTTRTTKRGNYALARKPGKDTYYAATGAVDTVAKETSLKLKLR